MTTMDTSSLMESQIIKLININEQEINEAKDHLKALTDEKETLEKFLEIYRHRVVSATLTSMKALKPQVFIGKTIRESLHIIAKNNDQLVIARDAVRLLKDAGVFGNPANASSVVYSALNNAEFVKVGKGVFRLSERKQTHNRLKSKRQRRIRKPSLPGQRDAIKNLKSEHPTYSMSEVRDTLVQQGFDFQNRNPGKSVNRVWMNLGYHKINQQPLFTKPEVNVINVPEEIAQKIIGK
jgi:hypothetical protein